MKNEIEGDVFGCKLAALVIFLFLGAGGQLSCSGILDFFVFGVE